MDKVMKSYSQAAKQLGVALQQDCFDPSEVLLIKHQIQDSYNSWAHMIYDKAFLNWGLLDKKVSQEYLDLNFNFSSICPYQDICAQTLLFYLIRPLIRINFFNKRLLDVGCGNGIGLKVSSELLKTEYALGLDLVNKLVTNSNGNFYSDNKINFIQSDAENLPFGNESFDVVTNLESSHLYPQIENFYSEVERVLSPGGFFCYADIHATKKQQIKRVDDFVNSRKNLKIILKHDITKMVQSSIYNRLVVNEDVFYKNANAIFGEDKEKLSTELPALARAMGLTFLPWWKMWFKHTELRSIAKIARKEKYWGKKCFFYYLIQKIGN